MSRTVTIRSLPEAFALINEMEGEDYDWGDGYRRAGRQALAEILEAQMALRVDRHLAEMAARGAADRRMRVSRRPQGGGRAAGIQRIRISIFVIFNKTICIIVFH